MKKVCFSDFLKLVVTQKLVNYLREVPNFAFFGLFSYYFVNFSLFPLNDEIQ